MKPKPDTMSGSATFFTYAYLSSAGRSLLKSAHEQPLGSNHCRVASVLFSAFAIEATLNHLGNELISHWSIIEPKLGWKEKLDILSGHLSITMDFGKRPFQTLVCLFKFRNNLAHGKTCEVEGSYNDSTINISEIMDPDWLKCWYSDEMVQRTLDDTKEIIEKLFDGANISSKSHLLVASGCYVENDGLDALRDNDD